MITIKLMDEVRDRLGKALTAMPSPYERVDDALLYVYPVFAQLPAPILGQLLDFGRYPDTPGAILLENLPVDGELPATPNNGKRVGAKSGYVAEGCLLGLSQLLGEPIGYRTEKQGEILHNVVPVKGNEYTQSNQGSGVFLNFHNDTVYDESKNFNVSNPDFLMLNCLRSDPDGQAATYYAEARDIVRALDAETLRTIRRPAFLMAAPSTFTRESAGGQVVWSNPLPLLTGPESSPEICMTANGIKPIGEAAEGAYRALLSAIDSVKAEVQLRPGRALLINNRKGVHARSVFRASFAADDRWLQRTYIRRELWSIRGRRANAGEASGAHREAGRVH